MISLDENGKDESLEINPQMLLCLRVFIKKKQHLGFVLTNNLKF